MANYPALSLAHPNVLIVTGTLEGAGISVNVCCPTAYHFTVHG